MISRDRRDRQGVLPARWERGQALVETTFVAMFLVLLMSGVIDLGRCFLAFVSLQNAAGEGAYYAAGFPQQVDSSDAADPNNIVYRTKHESSNETIDWSQATVSVSYMPDRSPDAPRVGDTVVVTVQYPLPMIGPLAGLMGWDSSITLTARASQRILSN